ncbi:MAG: FkbM family methyltransferase [Candidatus Nanoarchaeia archaeon]
MKHTKLNSITIALKDLTTTKTIKGKKTTYKISNILAYADIFMPGLRPYTKKIKKRLSNKKIIIHNHVGKFEVDPTTEDISLTHLYFEYFLDDWLNLKKKDVFIDVGACEGIYSIKAHKKKYKKIYSLEPNPETLKKIRANIKLNKIRNITLFNKAISLRKNHVKFYKNPEQIGQSKIIKNSAEKNIIIVTADTLDNLLKKEKLEHKHAFIKIDVEGHEYEAILGAEKTLQKVATGSRIMVEIWNGQKNKEKTTKILNKNGFVIKERLGDDYLFEKIK